MYTYENRIPLKEPQANCISNSQCFPWGFPPPTPHSSWSSSREKMNSEEDHGCLCHREETPSTASLRALSSKGCLSQGLSLNPRAPLCCQDLSENTASFQCGPLAMRSREKEKWCCFPAAFIHLNDQIMNYSNHLNIPHSGFTWAKHSPWGPSWRTAWRAHRQERTHWPGCRGAWGRAEGTVLWSRCSHQWRWATGLAWAPVPFSHKVRRRHISGGKKTTQEELWQWPYQYETSNSFPIEFGVLFLPVLLRYSLTYSTVYI